MLEILMRGGWALWVITFCSVVALAVTLERWRTLRQANIDSEGLLNRVSKALEAGQIQTAIEECEQTPGPIAETVKIGLRKLIFLERIGKKPEEIEEGIVKAMEDHGGHVFEYLERNLTALATVASLAPILGMMGTVIGMIRSFGSMGDSGQLSQAAVATGISEALLCTAGGLVVAALATVEYNYFTTKVNRFVLRVQNAATNLVERVLDTQSAKAIEQAPQIVQRPRPVAVATSAPTTASSSPRAVAPQGQAAAIKPQSTVPAAPKAQPAPSAAVAKPQTST